MYQGSRVRSRNSIQQNRDLHSAHPVHLTLNTGSAKNGERQLRYIIPERLTREQATTFRPSDLPIGQLSRKSSAHSDAVSSHTVQTGPTKTLGYGTPSAINFLSLNETKNYANKNRSSMVSPSKSYTNGETFFTNNSKKIQKSASNLDRTIFAENSTTSGIPVIYRSAEEKSSNPDRLNLDRRNLKVCPIIEGEDVLRLLNLQHNLINKIENLSVLNRLIFLDLYDNNIEDMSGIAGLKSLRVLMLGKNRIKKINGLENLSKLDVLDLHGNHILNVQNLNQLKELRVLNLAGNHLEHIDNLQGMDALTELNLRRNNILTIESVDFLPSLLRLFLSFNDISKWDDIKCLGNSSTLLEVTLDGNPITSDINYKQVIIKSISQLRQLDMKRITDEEKRVANLLIKREEERKRELHRQTLVKEKKRLAIKNAALRWKAEFSFNKVNQVDKAESSLVYSNTKHNYSLEQKLDKDDRSWLTSVASWATEQAEYKISSSSNSVTLNSLDVSQSFLAEIENNHLFLFGPKSTEYLDKNLGTQVSSSVTTVVIQFLYFDDFVVCFDKLRLKFPNITHVVLKDCGISSFRQVNCLAQLKKLNFLTIDCGEGNPLTEFILWKFYCIFRLSHFPLLKLNGQEVTSDHISKSEKIFGSLSLASTSKLSQYRLSTLYNTIKTPQTSTQVVGGSKEVKKKTITKETNLENSESLGKIALQYLPSKRIQLDKLNHQIRHSVVKDFIEDISASVCSIELKQNNFFQLWPQIFIEMVTDCVIEMNNLEKYVQNESEIFYNPEITS